MGKARTPTYTDKNAAEAKDKLFPNGCITNKIYKQSNGIYAYMNQAGYIHALEIYKNQEGYYIQDWLLNKKGMLTDAGSYGNFETISEARQHIEEGENYAGMEMSEM